MLRQLIHSLADKDPIVRRECLDFLRKKIELPPQSIVKVDAEEIWALWEELESDLSELDEYGGGSEGMEEHVGECLSQIEELLREKEISKEERAAFIEEVLPFIRSGNAGMDNSLYDVAYAACKDHEDWLSLAQNFVRVHGGVGGHD